MEDPIIMSASNSLESQQKDISPFESEACENYLKGFKLNIEELVPPPSETKPESEESSSEASTTPNKVQSRRLTLEINGVQVKTKTLAEYKEAIKRKSFDGKTSDESRRKSLESQRSDSNRRKSLDKSSEESKRKSLDRKSLEDLKRKSIDSKDSEEKINDENKSRLKSVRRHTIESEKKNVKVLGEHCNKKASKGESHKVSKVKEEVVISQENTITRSGRVSKKVLKTESVKEKPKKQEEEENEDEGEVVSKKGTKKGRPRDYCSNSFLLPDSKLDVKTVDRNVIMYTGAGRHLHPYAIHNYNLLTENTFDVSSWQRDFALTALSNNIDSSGRSIFRSTVPLISTKLNLIKNNLKEGKSCTSNLIKTETIIREEKPNRSRRRKKRKAVWTKTKTHSIPAQAAKKMKDESNDNSLCDRSSEDLDMSSEKDENLESSLQVLDEVKTLKRKLNQNEEDDLHWEMYGTPQKRVKLKLIQTQTEGNKKPQWTSVNTERESRPEETEGEMVNIVNTVVDAMVSHVEYNTEYNDLEITHDPTYAEEYKLETEDAGDTLKTLKRKRNNSSRVKWELKRLDVLIFEQESEAKNGDGTCGKEFCKFGCVCESIQVRPKHRAINHCSKIDCIFKCICPAPRRNDPKPPIRDESEIIRSIAEKRNGRNLAKKEKEWIQTLVKTNDEYIIMQSTSANKNKREVKKPERYREESLHWENVAHQKFLYEKVKRSLREKAKKATKDDSSPRATSPVEDSNSNDSSSIVSLKDKKRAKLKLLKRLRKKKLRLQEMSQQNSEENKPNKTSPFKFVFCKEHSVLDCKCKVRKETKEEGGNDDNKLEDMNEEINTLTNNLKNLTSDEKDKLLSLMRKQQTLTENQQEEQSTEGNSAGSKDEAQASNNNTDEEYIDLNTLSKFIPNPDGERTPAKPKDVEVVKQAEDNVAQSKGDSDDSRLSDDIEIVEEENDKPAANQNDYMQRIKIQSVRSLQREEFDKAVAEEKKKQSEEDDIEVLDDTRTSVTSNGTIVTTRQSILPKPTPAQGFLSDKSLGGNQTKNIDVYGFMLHNAIGYLPICQYSPQQLYLIFKDPTRRDNQSIIFHGTDYLQKASTWANGFLKNCIKFHPKYSPNPIWKIIKFSTTRELNNWKLFDFKFLKDYSPMMLTGEGVYKVKNKILYKLLLVPRQKTMFKFKQVMEAKLDMDDVSFIEKYEFFHNCRDKMPNNRPIRFIQRKQVADNDSQSLLNSSSGSKNDATDNPQPGPSGYLPPSNNPPPNGTHSQRVNVNPTSVSPGNNHLTPTSAVQTTPPTSNLTTIPPPTSNLTSILPRKILPSPTTASKPGAIFVKPTQSLLQRPITQSYLKPSAPVRSIPNVSQMMHRKNIMDNLTRLAMSRLKSSPPQTGQSQGQSPSPNVVVGQPNMPTSMLPPGIAGNPLMGSFTPRNPLDLLQFVRPAGRNPLHSKDQRPSNPSVVKVDNVEYGKFIQISDLISANKNSGNMNPPPSTINKSHPILCKSLAAAPIPEPEKVCIEKLPAGGKDAVDTSNDIEASLDSFKISKMRGEDSNNNTSVAVSASPVQPQPPASHASMAGKNVAKPGNTEVKYNNKIVKPHSWMNTENPANTNHINPGSTMHINVYKPRNSTSPATAVSNNPLFNPRNSNMISNSSNNKNTNMISNNNNNSAMFSQRHSPLVSPQGNNPTPSRSSTSPRKLPVPGLKPIKPLPALKAISPMAASPKGQLSVSPKGQLSVSPKSQLSVSPAPSKRLSEEVEITVSPVNNAMSNPVEINLNSSSDGSEISIVECLTRMDNKFTPITITPNGEDSVTISPIMVNTNNKGGNSERREPRGVTVFEKLTAIKRLNDGETPEMVAASINVSIQTLHSWLLNFDKLQKRTLHRGGGGFMRGVGGGVRFPSGS